MATDLKPQPRNLRLSVRGFTVLELLIAATIAILIFVIGLTLLNGASQARLEAQKRLGTSDAARMAFEALERDLSGAYTGARRRADLIGQFASSSLQYTAMTTTTEERGAAAEWLDVRYFNTNRMFCREVAPNTPLPQTPPADVRPFVLCTDVDQMTASFAKWVGGANPYAAASSSDATHLLVQLRFLDPNEKLPLTERVRYYQKYIPIPDGVKP